MHPSAAELSPYALVCVLVAGLLCGCDGAIVAPDAASDAGPGTDAASDAEVDLPDARVDASIDQGAPDLGLPDMRAPDMAAPPDLGPPIGEVVISRWQADSKFVDDEIYAQAVFAPDLIALGLQNPLGYLFSYGLSPAGIAVGAFQVAPVGEFTRLEVDLGIDSLADLDILDAGNALLIGEDLVLNAHDETIESDAAWLYESLVDDGVYFAERYGVEALDLYIAGGADVPEMTLPGAVALPEPLILTSHDVTEILPVRYGVPLTLSWVPSNDPDDTVLVVVETDFDGAAVHVDDAAGAVDLGAALRAFDLSASAVDTVSVIRRKVSQIATHAGTVQISTHARQVLLAEPVGAATVTPRVIDRGGVVALDIAWWDGTLAEDTTVDLGPDVIVLTQQINETRHILRLEVAVAEGARLGARPVTVRSGDTVQVALIDQLFVADELPMAGECGDAQAEPPLQPGTWRGSLAGLFDSGYDVEGCLGGQHAGADQAIPIQLRAGETLIARVIDSRSIYGLHLIDDCDDFDPVEFCYTRSSPQETTEFIYQAFEDESRLLIIDELRAQAEMRPGETSDYILDLQILPPSALLVDPDFAGAGGELTFDLRAAQGSFDETSRVTFDGGPIDAFEIVDPRTIRFDAPIPDEQFSRWMPVEATLAGGAVVRVDEAVQLVPFREPANDCAGADDDPPLRPGSYNSLTFLVQDTIPEPPQCGAASGPEGVFRVELGPAQTARFWVYAQSFDPVLYLLEDCAPTAIQCVDYTGDLGVEYLEFVGGPEPATVYLVVDGFGPDDTGSFELEMEIVE